VVAEENVMMDYIAVVTALAPNPSLDQTATFAQVHTSSVVSFSFESTVDLTC
jgi:hypothetical protein